MDVQLLIEASDDRVKTIQRHWKEHPVDFEKYQAYTAGGEIGYDL